MKNIKFRVWDTYLKIMSSGAGLTVAFKDGRLIEVSYEEETSSWSAMPDCLKNNRFITQQFTGLQDKNGVDIYEGDIVNYISYKRILNGIVEWEIYGDDEYVEKLECWMVHSLHNMSAPLSCMVNSGGVAYGRGIYSERGSIEVIGNIYENPELIEK